MFQITLTGPEEGVVRLCLVHDHGRLNLSLPAAGRPWAALAAWGLDMLGKGGSGHTVEFDDKKYRYRLTARPIDPRERPCRRFLLVRHRLQHSSIHVLSDEELFKAREDYGRFMSRLYDELSRFNKAPNTQIPQQHQGDSWGDDSVNMFLDLMRHTIIE